MLQSPSKRRSMHPPHEDGPAETLPHAIEALNRSDRPLSLKEIMKPIPPPWRVDAAELERLLKADPQRIFEWPGPKAGKRYWARGPEARADEGLFELLRGTALTAHPLGKNV